ncbi:MAG: hypothetical protein KTR31_06615 [Myxococcales bacterium]|nr:hypothetical protein [Myxococcales bacterium]
MSTEKHTPSAGGSHDPEPTLDDLEQLLDASHRSQQRFARLVTRLCRTRPAPGWAHDDDDRPPTDQEIEQLLVLSRSIDAELQHVSDDEVRRRRLQALLRRIRRRS